MTKDELVYIEHIYTCVGQIEKYLTGLSLDEFENNQMAIDAVIRNYEVIGEASKKISKTFQEQHPQFPWSDMIKMRNKLIHEYTEVAPFVLYETAKNDLPSLKNALQLLLNQQ